MFWSFLVPSKMVSDAEERSSQEGDSLHSLVVPPGADREPTAEEFGQSVEVIEDEKDSWDQYPWI